MSAEPSSAAPPSTQPAAAEASSVPPADPAQPATTGPAAENDSTAAPPAAETAAAVQADDDCGCGPATSSVPASADLPTAADLAALDALPVLDGAGNSSPFRAVYAGGPPAQTQHLVVFLRHFLCGNCQEYVRHLAHHLPPSTLGPGTAVTLISCGAPSFVAPYAAATASPFPLLTDPTGATYEALRLARSLSPGPRPEYMRQSFAGTVVSGVAMGVAMGRDATRSGEHDRIGGEFLFRRDGEVGEWKVVWVHRMKNTRDHVEISVLRDVLGLAKEEGEAVEDRKRSAMDGWTQFKQWVGAKGKGGAEGQQGNEAEEKAAQNGVEATDKNGVKS